MKNRSAGAGVCALVAVVLLTSGCGSGIREADGVGNPGTRVCVKNQSPTLFVVTFTKKDTSTGEGQVTPGAQACAEGTFFTGTDVEGIIRMAPPSGDKRLSAGDPWFFDPFTRVKQDSDWVLCVGNALSENQRDEWDDGVLLYSVERLADDQWREFVITIERSQQPSPSGVPLPCNRYSG